MQVPRESVRDHQGGEGTSKSALVGVWGKALGNLRRQHVPRTSDLGKVGYLQVAFRRDDSVYL
jgi:hypothetical protein